MSSRRENILPASSTLSPAADVKPMPVATEKSVRDNSNGSALQIQRSLSVGAVDDPLEEEADATADKVMRMAEPHFIQRKCSHCEEEEAQRKPVSSFIQKKETAGDDQSDEVEEEDAEEEEEDAEEEDMSNGMEMSQSPMVQKKHMADNGKNAETTPVVPFIQRKTNRGEQSVPDEISSKIQSTKGGGATLPSATKNFMEDRFGTDFSGVNIHTGEYASSLSNRLNAQAFTVGNDIYFNSGKFEPSTDHGKRLIAHELTHTIQQGNNSSKAMPRAQRSFWSGIKKVAGKVWSGIKTAGKWIAGGAKKAWHALKWFGGQLIDKIAGVFQRFAYWFTQIPTRVYRFLSGLWKGLKTFKPWTRRWWKSLAEVDTWKNFAKWITTAILDAAEIIGVGEAYQTLEDFVKFNTRLLKADELKAGKSIFGSSINFDFIRVDEAAVLGPAITKRAYTSFHTINTWGTEKIDVMVHEMTHVWQYENAGAIYMPQALHAQFWGVGYNYNGVLGLQQRQAAGKGLLSFNREQQAQIVQDFYTLRQTGFVAGTMAKPADIPLYASFVKEVSSLGITELTTKI